METWKQVWRRGVAPLLSTKSLRALRHALVTDDVRLIQGCTTTPPPLQCVLDWPIEGACIFGWCGWHGEGLETVGEVEEYFSRLCFLADERLGEPAAVRYLLNYYDDAPRDEMRQKLLAEVDAVLAARDAGLLDVPSVEELYRQASANVA